MKKNVFVAVVLMLGMLMVTDVMAVDDEAQENEVFYDCLISLRDDEVLSLGWTDAHFIVNEEATVEFLANLGTFVDVVSEEGDRLGYVILDEEETVSCFSSFEMPNYELDAEMFAIDRDMLSIKQAKKDGEKEEESNTDTDKNGKTEELGRSSEIGLFGTNIISGVTHNLQGTTNCIAAAAANVIWYQGTHGHSSYIGYNSWASTKTMMASAYSAAGGYANNNTQAAINNYLTFMGLTPYTILASVSWTTNSSSMRAEIDAQRPCMLGFAAGPDSYSTIVGHMTMCYGYYTNPQSVLYSVLADGHQSSAVYKRWDTDYNDCTISITPV